MVSLKLTLCTQSSQKLYLLVADSLLVVKGELNLVIFLNYTLHFIHVLAIEIDLVNIEPVQFRGINNEQVSKITKSELTTSEAN